VADVNKNSDDPSTDDDQSISLEQLSQSFAQLIGESIPPVAESASQPEDETEVVYSLEDVCPTTPRTILEAMLFVGHPSNTPLTSRQAASLIRGVSPAEVESLVAELNAAYEANSAPYRIISEGAGYRLSLTMEYAPLRERFYGRIRQARLSQSAIDVLALIAYNQPLTKQEVDELRHRPSGGVLSQLVRRELLRIERVEEQNQRKVLYRTTDRFLELFDLESIDDLPRSQEIDSSI
jgi:segregation and condensation protein B